MSTLKANEAQLGQSAESADNYVFSNTTGVLNLAAGSAGNTQDNLISVQATNVIDVAVNTTVAGSLVVPTVAVNKTNTNVANVQYVDNAISTYYDYYNLIPQWQTVATIGAIDSALVFDTAGNLYWAVANNHNDVPNYSQTSYVYKITPQGSVSIFASVATIGAFATDLVFDTAGNLYWAITHQYNGSSYSQTSYVYKITAGGTLTTFASVATLGAMGTKLIFKSSGELLWAVTNATDGTAAARTSYIYKISSTGTMTILASTVLTNAYGADLIFDDAGNLYWAIGNDNTGSSTSNNFIYKIDAAGNFSTFASVLGGATQGAPALTFDDNGNLYWAVINGADGSGNRKLNSYVYKITSSGQLSQYAAFSLEGAYGGKLIFDAAGNLFWSISGVVKTGGIWSNLSSVVVKITSAAASPTVVASYINGGSYSNDLIKDSAGNLYWGLTHYYNGTTYALNSNIHVLSAQNYFV